MKFWRQSLLATISFFAVSSTVLYTSSCADDSCTKLKCRNGGTCSDGACKCPTGWEGTQCESRATDRYYGFYVGTTTIDNQPTIIDSASLTYPPNEYKSASKLVFMRYTRPNDIINVSVGADGTISYTDGNYGGRIITIREENEKLTFTSVEHPNGVEQTIKFVGSVVRQ